MMRRMFERLSSRVAILGFTLGLVTAAGFALGQLYLSELYRARPRSSGSWLLGIDSLSGLLCCEEIRHRIRCGASEPVVNGQRERICARREATEAHVRHRDDAAPA